MSESRTNLNVDPRTLGILRCPLTHSALRVEGDEMVAEVGGLRYPIRDGFPVLIAEEAKMPPNIASLEEFKQKFVQQIDK